MQKILTGQKLQKQNSLNISDFLKFRFFINIVEFLNKCTNVYCLDSKIKHFKIYKAIYKSVNNEQTFNFDESLKYVLKGLNLSSFNQQHQI